MASTLPDPDAGLLDRLHAGDPTASSDLCVAYVVALVEQLRRGYPLAHDHALNEAAGDALLSFIKNPHAFDSTKGTLAGYLRMAATADLRNILAKEARHHRNRESADCVEDAPDRRNDPVDEPDGPSFDDPGLAAVIASFDDIERRFFALMRIGTKQTPELAPVLGLADAPADVQKAEVKKMRDRIMKRLERGRDAT